MTAETKLITALATPFVDGEIDKLSYEKLIHFQLEQGADALLAVGTTAEAQLLCDCEKKLLIKIAKGMAEGVPVYVGVEGRSTSDAVREAELAERYGADGILVAPPSFCKCTAEGYSMHVEQLLNTVSVPLILYNAPSRCGYALDLDVLHGISDRVHYLKDAGSDLDYTEQAAKSMNVLCGNDKLLPRFLKTGAIGVISVVSNVAPRLTRKVLQGENSELFQTLADLSMREINPIPIKYMLQKMGIFSSCEVRLPLTAACESTRIAIDEIWNEKID